MEFRNIVREVLSQRGIHCSIQDLESFSDTELSAFTGLPCPREISSKPCQSCNMPELTITFEGENSPYVRMDRKGLKMSLKHMKEKTSTVIYSHKIRVEVDFGLDAPLVAWLFTKRNFTRESLAVARSMQYRKIFDNRQRYKVWCSKLAYVHLYAIYYDKVKNVYRLDVDLHN